MNYLIILIMVVSSVGCKRRQINSAVKHAPINYITKISVANFRSTAPVVCLGMDYAEDCVDKEKGSWLHPAPGARMTDVYFTRHKNDTQDVYRVDGMGHHGIDFAYNESPRQISTSKWYSFETVYRQFGNDFNHVIRFNIEKIEGPIQLRQQTNGAPTFAAQSGMVLFTDRDSRSAGNWIVIGSRLPGGFILTKVQKRALGLDESREISVRDLDPAGPMLIVTQTYMHLLEGFVKSNDMVKIGDIIGKIGNTGQGTGAHLHYEIQLEVLKEVGGKVHLVPTGELLFPFSFDHPYKENYKNRGEDVMNRMAFSCGTISKEHVNFNFSAGLYVEGHIVAGKKIPMEKRWFYGCAHQELIPSLARIELLPKYYPEMAKILIPCPSAERPCPYLYINTTSSNNVANIRDKPKGAICGLPLNWGEVVEIIGRDEKRSRWLEIKLSSEQKARYFLDRADDPIEESKQCERVFIHDTVAAALPIIETK